jgi:hypothetical protein
MTKVPLLVTDGLRMLERYTRRPAEPPLAGLGPALVAGACVLGGVAALGCRAPWPAWSGLFLAALFLALRRR